MNLLLRLSQLTDYPAFTVLVNILFYAFHYEAKYTKLFSVYLSQALEVYRYRQETCVN